MKGLFTHSTGIPEMLGEPLASMTKAQSGVPSVKTPVFAVNVIDESVHPVCC